MSATLRTVALVCALASAATALRFPGDWRTVFGGGPHEYGTWDYVEVRPGAQMFWWHEPCLKECLSRPSHEQPLIVWLQGGPGASSTGYGQFEEIGLWEQEWVERPHTWLEHANILFVDSPVGTGFSYVEDDSLFATTADQAADDLVELLRVFMRNHIEMRNAPLFIFCESYGGKIGTATAVKATQAIADGSLQANFMGLALGDSWISGSAFTGAWGDMLTAFSLVDDRDLQAISGAAMAIDELIEQGHWTEATHAWAKMEQMVVNMTAAVSFYNVLEHDPLDDPASVRLAELWTTGLPAKRDLMTGTDDKMRKAALSHLAAYHHDPLWRWMNGPVKEHLNKYKPMIPANVTWGMQADGVFQAMSNDFMKDVVHHVDELLSAGVPVTVYNGQLDLICCTLGVEAWMSTLRWKHYPDFSTAEKTPLRLGDSPTLAAFVKRYRNLEMYTIMTAGHMIPIDQPVVASEMVRMILEGSSQHPREYTKADGSQASS